MWAGGCQPPLGWKPHIDIEAHPVVMKPQSCLNAAGNSPPPEVTTCFTSTAGATTGC